MMRGTMLVALVATILLSGCMSELTDRMDATNARLDEADKKMAATLETMVTLHYDQQMMGAVEKMGDQEWVRLRAFLIFLEKGEMSDVIWQYIGTPYPILSPFGPVSAYQRAEGPVSFNIRNVSFVHDKMIVHEIQDGASEILYRQPISAVNAAFHELAALGAEKAPGLVLMIHAKGYKSDKERKANEDRARRIVNAGTAIWGAADLNKLARDPAFRLTGREVTTDFLNKAASADYFVKEVRYRRYYANLLLRMVSTMGMREEVPVLVSLVEKRLGLDRTQWNYPLP